MADKEQNAHTKMWFHPVNGAYVVCGTANEVPEGFVDTIAECSAPVLDKLNGPARCTDFAVEGVAPKKTAKKVVAQEPEKVVTQGSKTKKTTPRKTTTTTATEPKAAAKVKKPTLKNLDLSRKEALEILDEDKIKFDAKASDDEIATLVEALLEED